MFLHTRDECEEFVWTCNTRAARKTETYSDDGKLRFVSLLRRNINSLREV